MQPKWQKSIGKFNQIWLKLIIKVEILKLHFVIFFYFLEPCIENCQNFHRIMGIENLKMH